jgi:ribosomal protein S6
VVVRFEAEPSVQSELDHTLKLADEVIRHKILLLPDKVSEKSEDNRFPRLTEA